MLTKNLSILLIEDDEDDFFILDHLIKKSEHLSVNLCWVKSTKEAIEEFEKNTFDLILIDYFLGANTAIDFLNYTQDKNVPPVIVLTGLNNREKDIEVMNAGASDYLPKEKLNENILERSIRYNIERKISNLKLINESKKYKQLFELSTDPFFVLNDGFSLRKANKKMLALLQINNNEITNQSLNSFIQNKDDYAYLIHELTNRNAINNKELKVTNSKGRSVSCILSITGYVDVTSNKIKYQGTIHDISLLKRIQEKAKNQEKISITGKMARTIAHEIRNPLTNISLSINEIKDISDNEEQGMFIDIIERSSAKINDIVTDFITSTKAPELVLEYISINKLIEQAIENCIDRIKLKEVKINTNFTAINLINADKNKLPLVFINLITNAIEALENQLKPTISIETYNENKGVLVIFTDNGKGMSEETIANLFSSFFTQKTSGLGIGMSTIHNVLASHDAYIDVLSTLDLGSTFKIYFD